jgi:hypothetical protein
MIHVTYDTYLHAAVAAFFSLLLLCQLGSPFLPGLDAVGELLQEDA